MEDRSVEILERETGYTFKDKSLLEKALTHSSKDRNENYEKLEFLGDSVLQIIISRHLYENHSELSEGEMTVTRAYTVCGDTLGAAAEAMGLHKHIIIGLSGMKRRINRNKSVLADVFEALTAAIYLDGGFETAEAFVLDKLSDYLDEYVESGDNRDYKTKLQHLTQEINQTEPEYVIKAEKGPAHDRTFTVEVTVDGKTCGKGRGKSKKKAQQDAAKDALKKFRKKGPF
jgi:ribonuclease-3